MTILKDGREERCQTNQLTPGSLVIIRPGERLPTDGYVISGDSALDKAVLTGESIPEEIKDGSYVLAGSLNLTGSFIYRAEKNR